MAFARKKSYLAIPYKNESTDVASKKNEKVVCFQNKLDYKLFIIIIVEKALKRTNGRNPRATHYILDEFCNIPKLENIIKLVTGAAGRNIFYHMFIQSFMQLDIIYGKDSAVV